MIFSSDIIVNSGSSVTLPPMSLIIRSVFGLVRAALPLMHWKLIGTPGWHRVTSGSILPIPEGYNPNLFAKLLKRCYLAPGGTITSYACFQPEPTRSYFTILLTDLGELNFCEVESNSKGRVTPPLFHR